MGRLRPWIVLLYLLATAVAPGLHDHGHRVELDLSSHDAGCLDPRPHVTGHSSKAVSAEHDECVACQFRAEHHGWTLGTFCFEHPAVTPLLTTALADSPHHIAAHNVCRGPPERS